MTDEEKAIADLEANHAVWGRHYNEMLTRQIQAVIEIAKRAIAMTEPTCAMCDGKPVVTGTAGCKDCNQYAEDSLRPIESPDDWVTQDIAPSRPEIDQCRFVDGDGNSTEWFQALPGFSRKHGDIIDWHRYEARCRRKDLPPKTHQVPVRLWAKEMCVGECDDAPVRVTVNRDSFPGWTEIKISPDGKVFIEVPR